MFQNGVPRYLALDALDNFQSIVDKTYLVATGGKKMSARDRDAYQIRASAFRPGSFITDFQIALYGVQLALPLMNDLGLMNLLEYTKETFDFLKLVFATKDSGAKPKFEINKSQNVTVHVGDIRLQQIQEHREASNLQKHDEGIAPFLLQGYVVLGYHLSFCRVPLSFFCNPYYHNTKINLQLR